jgi:hypothetical protein
MPSSSPTGWGERGENEGRNGLSGASFAMALCGHIVALQMEGTSSEISPPGARTKNFKKICGAVY